MSIFLVCVSVIVSIIFLIVYVGFCGSLMMGIGKNYQSIWKGEADIARLKAGMQKSKVSQAETNIRRRVAKGMSPEDAGPLNAAPSLMNT